MNMDKIVLVILANLLPVSEQLGGIPLSLALGLSPFQTFFISLVSSLVFFPVYFVLRTFYKVFISKIEIFNLYLKKVWRVGKPYVDKYGIIGIAIFVFLPLPLTGAYTGTMLAWLLGLDWKKSFLAVFLGCFMRGLIVLFPSLGFLKAISVIQK
jgi:uncharacterized membrane protein